MNAQDGNVADQPLPHCGPPTITPDNASNNVARKVLFWHICRPCWLSRFLFWLCCVRALKQHGSLPSEAMALQLPMNRWIARLLL